MGIREIAQEANVSIATVSRVLNNPELVNEQTRSKILQIIKKHEYKKFNDFILKNEIHEIAVIIPKVTNPFFSRLIQGINQEAQRIGFIINLFLTNDEISLEKEAIDLCIKKRIKGVVFIRVKNENDISLENVYKLENNDIPFVLVDRDMESFNYSGVFLSNANAVYDSINLLISKGYKNITVLAGDVESLNSKQRIKGYMRALNDNNIEMNEENILNGDFSIKSGYELTLNLLDKKKLPDVIFSFTNELMIGCIKALKDRNIDLSKDLKLFSFNKLDTSEINILFDISYIEHDVEEMGEKSIKILKNQLVGTKGSIREILDYKIQY